MTDEVLAPDIELFESMRSVGYSFEDAIADLVDNSITANANRVDITGDPVDGSYVVILDDGNGMSPRDARKALQLAGTSGDNRADGDLGRFGLGLKTASLSQGRKLTLATKLDGEVTVIQWDLDYVREVREWRIKVLDETDIRHIPEASLFATRRSGTMVIWESLDHLIGKSASPPKQMAKKINELHEHLGLVFHQYLDSSVVRSLTISINSVVVKSLDPFLSDNPKTQRSPLEYFEIEDAKVQMQSFVLPHSSALTEEQLRRKDLSYAMQSEQGFYIYRAHRLIDWGRWYGVARQSQLTKQTRIKVDFPNTLDHLWKLDIRKSKVQPPREFLDHYRALVLNQTRKSERMHTYRGRTQARDQAIIPLWNLIEDRNEVRYEVNLQHPMVLASFDHLNRSQQTRLRSLLKDVSAHMPAQSAYVELAENRTVTPAEYDPGELMERFRALHVGGFLPRDAEEIINFLVNIEPFSGYEKLDKLVYKALRSADD